MPRAVITHDLPVADALRGHRDDLSVVSTTETERARSLLGDAEILVCNPVKWDDRLLDALDSGDWVQVTSAGYDAYPADAFRERDVAFSNATGIHDPVVAEHAFALALAFSRKIPDLSRKQTEKTWGPRRELTFELSDWANRTLTVYGLGNIGEAIVRRGLAFEMDIYGIKRDPTDYDGRVSADRVLPPGEFHDILPETDLLVAVVPLTEKTRGGIDAAVFEALPASAVLVNVARGPVVDEKALLDALRTGEIAGAGLDVFEREPLPEDSPLWDREDVLVTPHVGGRSDTFPQRFGRLFLENYDRWRGGNQLVNQVV